MLSKQNVNKRIERRKSFDQRMGRIARKYIDFESFDYFSEKEERNLLRQQKLERYSWKSEHEIRKIHKNEVTSLK